MSITTRILSFVSITVLLGAALGITGIDFLLIKLVVFISSLYLAVISFRSKEYPWLMLFAVIAALFIPLRGVVTVDYPMWRLIDGVSAVIYAVFVYRYYDSYRKGSAFEKFVLDLFPGELWAVEDWTKDKSRRLRRHVESDRNPDLTLRDLKTGQRFAVECKFRSRFWATKYGTGVYWDKYGHDHYQRYGEKEKLKVKVFFGVGGNPKKPSRLFAVPLEDLSEYRGKVVPAQFLATYEKNAKAPVTAF